MDEKNAYWAAVALGALSLFLFVVNVSLANGNRHLQEQINQRQATIGASAKLSQINGAIAQALADISVKNNDTDARDLLTAQGITINAPAAEDAKDAKETKASKKKAE